MKLVMLIICAAMGMAFGVLSAVLMALFGDPLFAENALFSGILFFLAVYAMYLVFDARQRKQRREAFARLPSSVIFAADAVLMTSGKLHLTEVYLSSDTLYLIRVDQNGMPMEAYPCRDIIHAHMTAGNELTICLTDDRKLPLRSSRSQALFHCLREQGWLPLQH